MEFLEKIYWNLEKNARSSGFGNYFHLASKIKQTAGKILRVWTKNEEHFEKFQEHVELFDQNLYGKLTFFPQCLLTISWSSASSVQVYTPGR